VHDVGRIVRPLLAKATDPELPVIAYGTDMPNAFALLKTSRTDDLEELHAKAIANLANQTVEIEDLDLGGFRFLAISNSFFAMSRHRVANVAPPAHCLAARW